MHSLLTILFVISVLAVLQTYVFYPLLILILSNDKKRSEKLYGREEELPEVCLLMAAYNEEKVIDEKIRTVMESDYPLQKIRFLIGSDASTDRTNEIIKRWNEKFNSVQLVEFKGRTGKSGIINSLAEQAKEEVFILTDANVMFEKDTIFNLIRHFKDPEIAQVCANIVKVSDTDKEIAKAEKSYIAIENQIKNGESVLFGAVMGAEGACYAIRKESFCPVPPKFFMDDFYITMNVIEQGRRIYFDTEAKCLEDVPDKSSEEFKRKVRISIGNYQNLFRYKNLLWPPWKGSAFAFWSHKVLRWLTPFFLIFAFVSSVLLSFYDPFYIVLSVLQLCGICSPFLNLLFRSSIAPLRYLAHFYMMNLALLFGFITFANGVESNVWQPTQRNV